MTVYYAGPMRRDAVGCPLKSHLGAIFVHVPKAGGTSVHAVLRAAVLTPPAAAARKGVVNALTRIPLEGVYSKHIKGAELRQVVGPDIWRRAYKFSMVRNPWATMVSSYSWWLQKAPRWPHLAPRAELVKAMGGFRPFLLSEPGRTMINEWQGTMSDWFAEGGADIVDFVGRVETIDQDLGTVLSQIGAARVHSVPHLNRSAHVDYRGYYDAETKAMVASRFADVIERFKYRF